MRRTPSSRWTANWQWRTVILFVLHCNTHTKNESFSKTICSVSQKEKFVVTWRPKKKHPFCYGDVFQCTFPNSLKTRNRMNHTQIGPWWWILFTLLRRLLLFRWQRYQTWRLFWLWAETLKTLPHCQNCFPFENQSTFLWDSNQSYRCIQTPSVSHSQ